MEKEAPKLKSVYTPQADKNAGPYYDIMDIHAHRYITGNIIPQYSHSPEYNRNTAVKKNVKYCYICHEIAPVIDYFNVTKITSSHLIDNLKKDQPQVDQASGITSLIKIDDTEQPLVSMPIEKPLFITKESVSKIINSKVFMPIKTPESGSRYIMFKFDQ